MKRLLARPEVPVLCVGLLSLLLSVAYGSVTPTIPRIQDEFSYLLGADTFSEGRLTTPTHPLWQYFETAHVLQIPTYQSKYPPGQALALALGRTLTGSARVGVWISLALAVAAICWMLQAWLPPPWPIFGGVLAATSSSYLLHWGADYMGGAVAMLGGALLLGALVRTIEEPRPRHAVLLGIGLLLLANSRPLEGLLTSLPAAAVLLAFLVRLEGPESRRARLQVLVPLLLTLAIGFLWMAHYNHRVTGNAFVMPYQVYLEDRGSDVTGPPDVTEDVVEGHSNHPLKFLERIGKQLKFHLGGEWLYALPILIALPWLLRSSWARLALLTSLLTLVVASRAWGAESHYTAPISAFVLALLVQSIGILVGALRRRPVAIALVGLFLIAWLQHTSVNARQRAEILASEIALSRTEPTPPPPPTDESDPEFYAERRFRKGFTSIGILARQSHVDRFERDGDRHLVLVRYEPGSIRYREWVYNRATIDDATSVWAQWPDQQALWPLLSYYEGRKVWVIEPERDPWKLMPFDPASARVWEIRRHAGARARMLSPHSRDGVQVEIRDGGDRYWQVQVERAHPSVESGSTCRSRFRARAAAPRKLVLEITQGHTPWRGLGSKRIFELDTDWRELEYEFQSSEASRAARLLFSLGRSAADVEIANLTVSCTPPADRAAEAVRIP